METLREYLGLEFGSVKQKMCFDFDLERVVDDWVLICFLVGNDFVPHLPQFDISTKGLNILYIAYLKVLPVLDGKLYF